MKIASIIQGDNLAALQGMPEGCADLIYIDPPFNTGRVQERKRIAVVQSKKGDRKGYQGKTYTTKSLKDGGRYLDAFEDYIGFLAPRLEEAYRVLADTGSLFFHVDYREVHYCKVLLDDIFGRASFINEIIWAYDYGGRSKKKWSAKHDNILWYAKNPKAYTYNYEAIDRIPYMAPGLVGPEKAKRGKTPTDVWWHTIVPTNGKEKTGYATQKPLGIVKRIVAVHSNPGDTVLDFFGGSGTTGEAAALLGRNFVLVDQNPKAIAVMKKRLEAFKPKVKKMKAAKAK